MTENYQDDQPFISFAVEKACAAGIPDLNAKCRIKFCSRKLQPLH